MPVWASICLHTIVTCWILTVDLCAYKRPFAWIYRLSCVWQCARRWSTWVQTTFCRRSPSGGKSKQHKHIYKFLWRLPLHLFTVIYKLREIFVGDILMYSQQGRRYSTSLAVYPYLQLSALLAWCFRKIPRWLLSFRLSLLKWGYVLNR